MTKKELAEKIVLEFLEKDMLDTNNYNNDISSAARDSINIVVRNLQDYIIISGSVLE